MPQTTTRDGVSLHYQDRGQGPPVLLLHGFPFSCDCFWPQLDALADRYRFIVPDHRGFGKSPVHGSESEMSSLAHDALGLLDALAIPTAVVGGVSMGGYVAMALLRQAPSRVRALVLLDTQATADDEAGKERRRQTAKSISERGMEVLVETMMPKLFSPRAPAAARERIERTIRANPPEGAIAATLGMAQRADSRELLSRYAGPALVVCGADDALTPVAKSEQLADLIKGSRLLVVPRAAHLAHLEEPAAVNAALEQFLSSM